MNNREVKFRAKTKVTNEWIYGFYYEIPAPLKCIGKQEEPKGCMIIRDPSSCPDWGMPIPIITVEVDRNTLGQYTGLKDKNGKEIYEGDILKYNHESVGELIRVVNYKYGMYGVDGEIIGIEGTVVTRNHIPFANILTYKYEVVGNIYENPELLK